MLKINCYYKNVKEMDINIQLSNFLNKKYKINLKIDMYIKLFKYKTIKYKYIL